MMTRAVGGWLVSALLFPLVARAQETVPAVATVEPSRRAFVEGSLLASRDRAFRFENDPQFLPDASWTLAAGGSIGWYLSKRWTLQADFELPRQAGSDIESHGHLYFLNATAPGTPYRTVTARRDPTVVALVGVQLGSSSRVRPSLLFGGGMALSRAHQSIEVQNPPGSAWSSVETSSSTANNPALSFGLDCEIPVNDRFAVVPRVRASIVMGQSRTSATILRSGIAGRWRF